MMQHPDVTRAIARYHQDDLIRSANRSRQTATRPGRAGFAHRVATLWTSRVRHGGRPAGRTVTPARAAVAHGRER